MYFEGKLTKSKLNHKIDKLYRALDQVDFDGFSLQLQKLIDLSAMYRSLRFTRTRESSSSANREASSSDTSNSE